MSLFLFIYFIYFHGVFFDYMMFVLLIQTIQYINV